MEEPEKKGLPTCGTSESIVNHAEKVGGETLEGSVDFGGKVQMEGSFSEELVGEDGACNGKDVMVEVLGSDVYIDGVCTRGTGAELNEVGCSGSVEGGEDLSKDVKSAGVSSGTEAWFEGSQSAGSHEAGSENAAGELDGMVLESEERDQAVVSSDKFDIASLQGESQLDNETQKEVGTRVIESFSVVKTTSREIEVSIVADVGVGGINAPDAGIPGQKVANTRCDNANALVCSLTVGSIGEQNVQSVCAEKVEQQERNLTDHGATDDRNYVTLKTWNEQNNIVGKLNSAGGQPVGISKVDHDSSTVTAPEEVDGGAEVAADRALLNSEEKQCFRLEKCTVKEPMADASQFSSDTGRGMEVDKDVGGDFALGDSCPTKEVGLNKNVSDSEQCSLHKGIEMEAEDQPETERVKIMDHPTESKGTLVDGNAISMIVEEDTQVTDQGHYVPLGAGKEKFHDESNMRQKSEVQASISEQVGSNGGQESEVEEFSEAGLRKTTNGKIMKRASTKLGSLEIVNQARYLLPKEKEGEFSVSDMVWGKVRSHPWWPGQIFDPSDSSEKAMKHYKKDCYLVAYFGDRTFAWNEASQLKTFRTNFSSIEKQSNSESFQNAVDCALDEITRRIEFGLACFCIPKDTYDSIKCQTVENTGIRQELSVRHGVDESLNASSFSPDKLIEYLKTFSELPTGGFDRLELVIAKAQLLAFYRFKGYSCLPELQYCGGLDNDMDTLIEKNLNEVEHSTPVSKNDGQAVPANLKSQGTSRHKRKHNLKDSLHPTKKERSLSELMSGTPDSPDGDCWSEEKVTDNVVLPVHSKKRRIMDHYADDSGVQDGRKTISLAKVSNTTKQSFKIGECIRRVASQLTGSPSVLKCSGDRSQNMDGSTEVFTGDGTDVSLQSFEETQRSSAVVPTEYSSLDDLLSSLKWVVQEPLGDYSFLDAIVSFFSDFRNSIVVADDSGKEIIHTDKVGTKRKKPSIGGSPETFEFEDMSDTYWTDRVIDNISEEQPSRRNRKQDYQLDPAEPGKPIKVSRRSNSRKRYSDFNHAEAPEKPSGYIDENAPAELVMNFAELDSVPSETSLNKMFRHFGPLKESETEVDRVSSRARVVFKKCADGEVACSSAKKFNIFGPILVNYELNYTPSALFKASSVATTHDQEMHLDLSSFEVHMV